MDFHGMNRKNLQIQCKKHGIPANLKNIEMANRLASLFLLLQKEDEKTVTETEISPEEDRIKEEEEEVVASIRKAKKVRFGHETDNQVFEFTRSLKKNDAKWLKRVGSSGSSTQEGGKDTDLNASERFDKRRSTRLAAKTEKPCVGGGTSKSVTLVPAERLVDVANIEDERETGEQHRKDGDSKVGMARRRSMRFVNEQDQRRRSVRLKGSVANPSMGQAMSKLKSDTVKAARVVKGDLVDKKMDENLVKSSKRVTRNMKRDRSAESEMDKGTASNQSNLPPKKTHFEQQEACGADVKAVGSSKKYKAMNQECTKDKPQGIVLTEDSPSSSKIKTAESVEKVFDPISVDSSQRSNARELNCESVEGECEENLERGTVMLVMEDDKEEVSSRSLSSQKDKSHVPTGHIIVATVIADESTKTKDEALIHPPESDLKEHSSIAKLANVEEIREKSTECWKEFHSNKDDGKDVKAENLHGKVSEFNTENSSAEEEMEISKVGVMSVGQCVNLTPEKLLGEYAYLEREEAERPNVEDRSSAQKMEKAVGQELVKDKPQKMSEGSPSTSETKTTEHVMISESVLDSTQKVSGDMSAVRNSHELDSELLEETLEEKHEQATVSLAATKKDKGEASPLSEFLIEGSEVKTCLDNRSTGCSLSVETTLSPASVQLAMSNPEADLVVPTGNDIVLTVITEENKITKEETLIFTPASELKEHGSVAELTKVETILVNSAECCKEDENGSLEKNTQAENLRVNYSEGNTENSSSEEEMEISKDSCMSANLTAEKLVDTYTQLVQEEAGGPHVEIRSFSKTTSSGFLKENTQGMVEDSPSTFVTKTTETIMMSENVSVDISPVGGNTQELNHELTDEEREEKQELNIVPVAETEKEKTKAPSPSEFLIEWTEVSIPESEQFVETTPPPPSVQIAVNNRESDLSVPTGHILVKDIVSPVIAEKDSKTEEGPKSVNSFVAKLAETDAVLETSPECWNESLSSKDDDRGSLENGKKSAKRHGNFSEYNAENSSAEEQADICEVGRISDGHCVDRETLDEVKDESLMKNVQTISSERGCKPNALELSGSFSTDFASHSQKEENVSECLEGEEMKALSQPTPINKAARNILDMSSLFTTPERNLMLMEKLSESGKIRAADIVTQHNDEAVESHYVVFTTPEQVLLLGDSGLDDSGKEEEHTATDFPDESNISTDVERHLLSEESGLHKTTKTKYNTEATCEESSVFISPERRQPLGNSEPHTAGKQERKEVEFKDESAFFTTLETRLLLGESGQNRLANGSPISAQYQSHCASSPKVILKDDSVVLESQVAAPDFRESTIADFSGSIASKVSYSHGFSTGEETAGAEFMPKASQAETDAGPDAIQSTSNQSRGNSLHVDSGNHFDFVTKAKDTIMDAYVFALPGEGNSQTTGEISNHTEVAGTCSLLSEESTPSTYIQNQIRDAVEELAVTDEPIDAKLTKYTQSDSKTFDLPVEGDSKSIGEIFCQYEVTGTCFMVSEKSSPSMDIQNHICDAVEEELAARGENELTEAKVTKKVESSGGSDVSGKASVLAGTEDEQLSYNTEVTDPVDTAFEKDISLAPDESTLEKNKNAEAVDDEMVNGEATPSPEETLVKPSDNNGESGTPSEKHVRREPVLIYRTQAKPKRHDMKENAPNSKIVDNLNVTAPRTSKRQPLQDLRKN